ncbi:hypothetical protein M3N55_10390 [Roseibaca sp. V10]|uniref:Uncharacterized protein n=1 Tax=Roseinatronobacter domitianus TaxID=2940293 RepID=A0ABT0M419_9RHOB|nr:hypothetical protein [Roseibaca domitiana]MCL1629140.1 hypothetical protein [Roseibaca domitiana]
MIGQTAARLVLAHDLPQRLRMHAVRSALLALMMVLMLPLGALNAWVPAVADATPHNMQTPAQSSAQTPRTCRSGFLPGAGCAKFFTNEASQAASTRKANPAHPPAQAWKVQDQPAPPKAPPRRA